MRDVGTGEPVFAYAAAGGIASLVHLMVEDANFTQQYIIYSWVFLAIIFLARKEVHQGVLVSRDSSAEHGQVQTRPPDGIRR